MSLEFSPVIVQLSAVPALDDVGVLYARIAISWSHVFCDFVKRLSSKLLLLTGPWIITIIKWQRCSSLIFLRRPVNSGFVPLQMRGLHQAAALVALQLDVVCVCRSHRQLGNEPAKISGNVLFDLCIDKRAFKQEN